MLLEQHTSDIDSIKNVAIYSRKSQSLGDKDEDLIKHRSVTKQICESKGWSYVEYNEIVSGDTIEARPKMQQLLEDIEKGLYDAIVTFDIDRLGRGGGGDRERIGLTLQHSNTFLVIANPYKIFDLNNDSDEQAFDMHSFMGRFEYKMIKKRFRAGKRIGLRMGRWVHGNCPYGYEYNRKQKRLDVVPEQKEIVRMIVNFALEGMSMSDIAWELNKRRIPSPRGVKWAVPTISRMLKSKVYLGYVVGNKSEGNRNRVQSSSSKPFRYLPEEEWVIVKNCHEPIITEEEYEQLTKIFERRPKRVYNNQIYQFSGLITCGKCKKNMSMKRFGTGEMGLAKCDCGNSGGSIQLIEKAVFDTLNTLRHELNKIKIDDINKQREELLTDKIEELIKECEKQDAAIERIEEAYEAGIYDIQKTRRKTEEREQEKWRLEKEISKLKKQLQSVDSVGNKERLTTIDQFLKDIKKDINEEKKNRIYKELIGDITWIREDNRVEIDINFL